MTHIVKSFINFFGRFVRLTELILKETRGDIAFSLYRNKKEEL
jgi:hypothetical protein